MYEKFSTKEHGGELIEDHDDWEEFFLHGMVFFGCQSIYKTNMQQVCFVGMITAPIW